MFSLRTGLGQEGLRMKLFNQQIKFIITVFSQGEFIRYEKGSEKVKLKENYTKWNYFFTRKITRADLFLKSSPDLFLKIF